MTNPLYAGQCECGESIIRRTLSGVAPKRCESCRRQRDGKSPHRVAGPPVQMRRWMRETRLSLEQNDAGSPGDLMRECAAVAIAETLGLPDDLADSILCAIDRLVQDGETGLEIRRRLNSSTFGLKRASEAGTTKGLEAAIMSFGNETA